MPCLRSLTGLLVLGLAANVAAQDPNALRYVGTHDATGCALAAVMGEVPLLHTTQMVAVDSSGQVLYPGDARRQAQHLLDALQASSREIGGDVVRLNFCVADTRVAGQVLQAVQEKFAAGKRPPVTLVTSRFFLPGVALTVDAVVTAPQLPRERVELLPVGGTIGESLSSIMPAGPRVYISGQAQAGDGDVASATRATLQQLADTVAWLGLKKSDIAHVKSFVRFDEGADAALKGALVEFFGNQSIPPHVAVEWDSQLPIEIELIVAGRPKQFAQDDGPVVYLTPEGMTASPIYCRVTAIDGTQSVYTSGLWGLAKADAEAQIRGIFAQLQQATDATGSDLRHLVKATYYVSADDSSALLNQIRPEFYDPQRPPAASKAAVRGVGLPERTITVDLISVVKP